MADERRKHPRIPLRSRCWCETDGITLYAKLINASEGGVFVGTYAPLRLGSSAKVRFKVDRAEKEVLAEAVVVWVREAGVDGVNPGMGMRFTVVDRESLDLLREFIARQYASEGHA